jgi:Secretion system C-terminal sorting domain
MFGKDGARVYFGTLECTTVFFLLNFHNPFFHHHVFPQTVRIVMNTFFCFSVRKSAVQAFVLLAAVFSVVFSLTLSLASVHALAQSSLSVPRVSIEVVNPSVGKSQQALITNGTSGSIPILYMRERNISLFRRDTAFPTGSIAIRRTADANLDQSVVVAFAVEYVDSLGRALPDITSATVLLPAPLPNGAIVTPPYPSATPVGINSLQGDLSPTTLDPNGQTIPVRVGSRTLPNTANILPGQREVLLRFTARWSDQNLEPRTAGLQGRRFVILTLLQAIGNTYELGTTLATVVLDDPERVGPVLLNAIQNKNLLRNATDLIELETPGFRSDGQLNSVFFDANFNTLNYTAFSSDSSIINVQTRQNDPRFNGRPSLFYSVQPGAPVNTPINITVVADDGTGLLARDVFQITVVSSITSVRNEQTVNFTLAPNPATERVSISAQAQTTGRLRIRLTNTLGAELLRIEQPVTAGTEYRQDLDVSTLPTGFYFVEVQDGTARSIRRIVKN